MYPRGCSTRRIITNKHRILFGCGRIILSVVAKSQYIIYNWLQIVIICLYIVYYVTNLLFIPTTITLGQTMHLRTLHISNDSNEFCEYIDAANVSCSSAVYIYALRIEKLQSSLHELNIANYIELTRIDSPFQNVTVRKC